MTGRETTKTTLEHATAGVLWAGKLSIGDGLCETCDTKIGPCSTSPLARQLHTDLTQFSVLSFSAELRAHDHTSNAHALAQDCAEKEARSHATCSTW